MILIGNTGVGKTSYSDQLVYEKYNKEFIPTLGVDFFAKSVKLNDNTVIKSHIWDTAGQEKFSGIITHYYKDIAGVIIMFDVSNRYSFKRVQYWKNELKNKCNYDISLVPVMLLGNKIDNKNREVDRDEAEIYALKNSMIYEEVSCKMNDNVDNSFLKIVNEIYCRMNPEKLGPGIKRHFSQDITGDLNSDLLERKCKNKTCCTIV
tara:strand:- start:783 stop:1400 length:618 start_codon:yes stop_codon:yes gene_type:complete